MNTEQEWTKVNRIIRKIAHEHHVSEAKVRADMDEAMHTGRTNPDPAVQARWATFHFSGEEPTLEEFILWAAAMVQAETQKEAFEDR